MTAIAVPPTVARPAAADAGFLTTSLQVAKRTVLKFLRTPQLVVVALAQGLIFLLIFRYVFGGAIGTGGVDYVDFLVPGFVVTSVLFSGMGAAAGVAEDVEQGLFDRLRSLPVSRGAVLTGRVLADTALLALTLAVTVGVGFAVGFRLDASPASALVAFGLCVLFGFAFDWLFVLVGLVAGNAQAAQGMSMIVFPLTFASSAYVPVGSMPGWLQAFVEHQPLTVMSDAARALAIGAAPGQTTSTLVLQSLAWSAGLVLAFAPLAVARFAKR